ncbi:RAD10 [Candida jiufengensis]|uniref:RAD10 n=1 Tax=Candida jiufengensis TaxID=497108 RepID=UPI0022240BAD|nr:RAD10 [Candida jiufengensis]KAI5953421.1 RAD10 [Candida jiufengensis]
MSGSNNNNDSSNNIDASSFASILAGVKRMRDEYGGDYSENDITIEKQPSKQQPSNPPNPPKPPRPQQPQITSKYVDVTVPRTTLEKPTAKPVPPPPQQQPQSQQQPKAKRSMAPARSTGPSEILVHKSQEKNPLLTDSMMKTTQWSFDSSVLSDYYISPTFQILFLSLKYHKLRPEYIWTRLKKLNKGSSVIDTKKDNVLRVLLVVVDIDSHQEPIRKLSDFCIKHDLSLVLAWSFEEAGNYIALGKHFDNAPHQTRTNIRGFRGGDYNSSVVEAFTGIKSVNKTDVSNLLANYKSVKDIVWGLLNEKT